GDPLDDRGPLGERPPAPLVERAGGGGESLLYFGVGREGELLGYLAGRWVGHLIRRCIGRACSRFAAVKVSVRQRYGRELPSPRPPVPLLEGNLGLELSQPPRSPCRATSRWRCSRPPRWWPGRRRC